MKNDREFSGTLLGFDDFVSESHWRQHQTNLLPDCI